MGHYFWSLARLCFLFVGVVSLTRTLPSWNKIVESPGQNPSTIKPASEHHHNRVKRSPFIMAFQVTKPPGMFQMSLRPPYIMNMMSNLTRSLFSSGFTDLIRRGFGSLIQYNSNSTVVEGIRSRQEDLELLEK